ncbi:membrane protein [Candidatus Magnetobacterium bavaricum]|uniref:Membrane protein n=1 Tax=Candidatus Magnetobacterium bavaricum TaxID=29290 RepID=A0A0F3H421_9BACT|nr:membrane protein [Candidatus Magnetobacterium bavaricum]
MTLHSVIRAALNVSVTAFKRWWLIGVISIAIFVFATRVPPNMDEFLQYHQLVCHLFPNATENVFREGCYGYYDLKIFGKFLPLRSFLYVGFTPSLFYLPMYLLWPYYLSARVMGILALLVITYMIHRVTRVPLWLSGLIVLFSFPVVFQCITDRGPVLYQMALMFVMLYLSTRPSPLRGVLAGLIMFVCIEQKPFFVNFIPAVLIVGFFLLKPVFEAGDRAGRLMILKSLLIAAVVAAVPTVILMTAQTRYGCQYYNDLLRLKSVSPLNFTSQIYHMHKNLIPSLVDFSRFANSIYDVRDTATTLTQLLWVVFGIIFFIGQVYAPRGIDLRRNALLAGSSGAFLLCLYLVNLSPHSLRGHHYVLAFPFLLLGIALSVEYIYRHVRALAVLLVLIVAVLNVGIAYKVVKTPTHWHDDWSKVKVLDYLRQDSIASEYVYVIPDWGIYCLFALYGSKQQIVLYVDPFDNPSDITRIAEIAQRRNRTHLFIAQRSTFTNSRLINTAYPNLKLMEYLGYNEKDAWMIKAE